MPKVYLLAQVSCIMGMVVLATSLLASRARREWFHLPLVGLLLVILVLVLPPLVGALLPAYEAAAVAAGLPAAMLLGPLVWFYVKALTANSFWRWSGLQLLHLAPSLAALGVVLAFQTLPLPVREALVLRGILAEGTAPATIATLAWLLVMLWVPQSCYYLVRSGRQLVRYRTQLKQVFANTEQREMSWLAAFIVLLGLMWLLAIAAAIDSNLLNFSSISRVELTALALLAVWVLSAWGLSQRPGFQNYLEEAASSPSKETVPAEKYSRSALDKAQSERIASKIETVMATDKLFLNADLNLALLAKAIDAQPNYVSQTLNETLGETFFDYVNRKRIEAAQRLLRDTDQTALDIAYAVGFNARSSFYKAFQRSAGMTPGQYRKSIAAGAPGR